MKQEIHEQHVTDPNGNPTGGMSYAKGIQVHWQDGPLGRGADRKEPNGAFVEGVIQIAIGRLEFFQAGKFACTTNAQAIDALKVAVAALESRTANREARGVEGQHEK